MKKQLLCIGTAILIAVLPSCSIFGHTNVETAPYKSIKKQGEFELRHYDQLVLVTTSMSGLDNQRTPFYKLFDYISGKNNRNQEIPMTAPVFMGQTETTSETISFVLPKDLQLKNTPIPVDPSVKIEEIKDYKVAAVTFNGSLKQSNIKEHKQKLLLWIKKQGLKVTGSAKAAGYNPPITIPALRRNEVLIPVED